MGLVQCHIHGDRVVAFASKAVVDAVVKPEGECPRYLEVTLNAKSDLESHHDVDVATIERLRAAGLLPQDSLVVSSEDDSLEIFCELAPVCPDCLREWRVSIPPV
jgi:hypothetical protein